MSKTHEQRQTDSLTGKMIAPSQSGGGSGLQEEDDHTVSHADQDILYLRHGGGEDGAK